MAAALIGLAVSAVVVLSFFWEFLQHGMLMAHEGAHAVVSALLFRKVNGVRLNADGTGDTGIAGAGWLGFVWFLLWLVGTVTAVAAGGKWLVMRS